MTTTRVTVPVEDLAGKLKAIRDKFLMPTPDKDFTDYAIMTRCVERLSAAPAPEGGAVDGPEDDELPGDFLARVGMDGVLWADGFRKMALKLGYSDMDEGWLISWFCNAVMAGYDHAQRRFDPALATRSDDKPEGGVVWFGVTGAADETEALAVALFDARCPGIRMTDEDLHYYRAAAQRAMQAVTDELDTPALATREEAPAEAGEWGEMIARLEEMADFFDGATNPLIPETDCDEHARDLRAALSALRAQPQAREDAQPVAYDVHRVKKGDEVWIRAKVTDPCASCCGVAVKTNTGEVHRYISPADVHAHPAPDALRVAVEALEPFALVNTAGWGEESQVDEMDGLTAKHLRQAASAYATLAALQAEQKGGAA